MKSAPRIAIASGKGGTGKTTLAINLALSMSGPRQLLDCDVEAPNARLFLPLPALGAPTEVSVPIPTFAAERCQACGACVRFCAFNALALVGKKPMLFPELCHSCGGCIHLCPQQAIDEKPRRIGLISRFADGPLHLLEGRLDVGVAIAPPLIRALRATARPDLPTLIDAPPGTSCNVVAALSGCDQVVLVTEPTPFGLHDLALAVEMARALSLPCGVVINRLGIGDDRVHRFCQAEAVPILAEIPDDRRIAEAYAQGQPLIEALPALRPTFTALLAALHLH